MRTMHACDQPRTRYACQPFIIIINNIISHDMMTKMTRHPSAITSISYKLLSTQKCYKLLLWSVDD